MKMGFGKVTKRPLRGISILKFALPAFGILLLVAALAGYKPRPDFLSGDDGAVQVKPSNTAHRVTYTSLTGTDGTLVVDAAQAVSDGSQADVIHGTDTIARLTTTRGDVIVLTGNSSTIWTSQDRVLTKGAARMDTNRDFNVTADSLTANFDAGTLQARANVVSVSSYGTIHAARLDARRLGSGAGKDGGAEQTAAPRANSDFVARYSGNVRFHACPGCKE
ncbi:hypothetical protein [Acidimangrovimonas sediminis]|uniref:hypothetical protein n=1 Tax=Acidimangrovimonas sediminis TaxID=2056283 RepID=UPI0011AF3E8B|nr:hypothetical protein [Acidimangrovimonas sediminis]